MTRPKAADDLYMSAAPTTDAPLLVSSDLLARLAGEIAALRETAEVLNASYAHSGLTNPRADRLTVRADGMEYALSALFGIDASPTHA